MKTQESLSKSADAAFKDARDFSLSINRLLNAVDFGELSVEEVMPNIDGLLAKLNQRVHEFNAYHNALTTD